MIYDFIVLKNGLPISTVNLHKDRGVCQDNQKFTLVSGFFQAITSFADSIENLGEVNELQMTDILFSFQRMIIGEKEEILFILSSTTDVPKSLRKVIIEEASSTFLHMFRKDLTQKWNGNITPFKKYKKVFRTILDSILSLEMTQFQEPDISGETVIISKAKLRQLYHTLPFEPTSPTSPTVPTVPTSALTPGIVKKATTPVSSNRFQRYRTLQHFQAQTKQISSQYANFMSTKPKQKFVTSLKSQERNQSSMNAEIPGINRPSVNLVAPVIDSSMIGIDLGGNSTPFPAHLHPLSQEEFLKPSNYMSYIQPQIQTEVMYMNREDTPNANLFHTSIFDLTPTKLRITAGAFRDQITEEWMKILVVAIDGRKSITQLAQQLDAIPMDILQACQILVKMNLVQFKK